MKKLIAVIGLDNFGLTICRTLANLKTEVLGIDIDRNLVSQLSDQLDNLVVADATHINALRELGIDKYDNVVIGITKNLEASILTLMNLKELGVKKITVRVDYEKYSNIFERLGADDIIIPEQDSGISLANKLINESFMEYYPVADGFGIIKIKAPKLFVPKSLIELDSRNSFDVNIVALIKKDGFIIPKGLDLVEAGDIITVIGDTEKLYIFEKFITGHKK
jgi:trk system potassium uptake protein TrkA